MSGFCWSRNALRGPGSVPPAPGRLGIGMVCPVCAWAAVAAIARPPAAVAANTLRREMFVMSSLASDSSGLPACRRMKRRSRCSAIRASRRGAGRLGADLHPAALLELDRRVEHQFVAVLDAVANLDLGSEIPRDSDLADMSDAVLDDRDLDPVPVEDDRSGGNDE